MNQKLVVIGSGMAGGKVIEEVLARNSGWSVTVIGDEPVGNYNRIKLLYKLLRDDVEEFFLNDEAWYRDHGVEAHKQAYRTRRGTNLRRFDRDPPGLPLQRHEKRAAWRWWLY